MPEVNHILAGKRFEAEDNRLSARTATYRKVLDSHTGKWWVWYTVGVDLSVLITELEKSRQTLGDPEITGLYAYGFAVHKRPIVSLNQGAQGDQLTADVDGENDYPRFLANTPICYTRENEGREWLVYAHGQHMKQALDELFRMKKVIGSVEEALGDYDVEGKYIGPLMYQGKQVYRRRVYPVGHPMGMTPNEVR